MKENSMWCTNYRKDEYQEFIFGTNNTLVIDKVCAVLLCLSPVFQHYIGVYKNAGFTLLLFCLPVLFFNLVRKLQNGKVDIYCLSAIVPLLLFEGYSLIRPGFSVGNILYRMFMMFIFFCIACGCVNIRFILKYAVNIAKIASIIIILQFVCYNLFDYHVQIIPVNYLLEGSDMWIERVVNGVTPGEGYRPSGMFLEPSHFFLYTFPLQAVLLLSPGVNKSRIKDVLLISIASLCSTSGMGVLVTGVIWVVFFLLYQYRRSEKISIKELFSFRTVLLTLFFAVLALMAYLYIPVVSSTVNRILVNDAGKSIAIDGRIRLANMLLEEMSAVEMVFGASVISELIEFNLSGFHATFYRFGIIGVILTYWFYGQGLFKLRCSYFYLSFIIIVVSYFSAHTHGTFYMLYYVLFLLNGYYARQ